MIRSNSTTRRVHAPLAPGLKPELVDNVLDPDTADEQRLAA
jgi:hypothetical protein